MSALRAPKLQVPLDAPLQLRATAPALESAFEQIALTLFASITDASAVDRVTLVTFACDAKNQAALLVEWLNALIHAASTRHLLFSRFVVGIKNGELLGQAWGERIDPRRHHVRRMPRRAELRSAHVDRLPGGEWQMRCTVAD